MDDTRTLVFAHHGGKTTLFERSLATGVSALGGVAETPLTGIEFGPPDLHQIATLSVAELGLQVPAWFPTTLPLLYGMSFESCDLRYRVRSEATEVTWMDPVRSSPDWPYARYPQVIPRLPLRAWSRQQESLAQFIARVPHQVSVPDGHLVILVPPPRNFAMSLWGADGDGELVTLHFDCSLVDATVHASNVCA